MKSVSLRTLVREPLKVKRMTRAGNAVQVTDNGEPLWILQPAATTHSDDVGRRQAIDGILDEVLGEKAALPSASQILEESRR